MRSIADAVEFPGLTPEQRHQVAKLSEYLHIHATASADSTGMHLMSEPSIANLLARQEPAVRDAILVRKAATSDYVRNGGRDLPFERRAELDHPDDDPVLTRAERELHRKMDEEDIINGLHERLGTPRAVLDAPNPERSVREAIELAANAAPSNEE